MLSNATFRASNRIGGILVGIIILVIVPGPA